MTVAVRRRALLVGLIGLAFALRVYRIDHTSFWLDEALTPLRAGYALPQLLRNVVVIQGYVGQDTHPPFYYLLIHVLQALTGSSDLALRYPSALFGALLVPVVARLGTQLFDQRTGLLAALFIAVNPQQVWYGQEARMYTLLVLLLALASSVLWQTWRRPPVALTGWLRRLLLYALPAGLAFYTHYTAVFLIAAQALLWGWLLWRGGQRRLIGGGLLLGLLAALPLLPIVIPRLLGPDETSYFPVAPYILLLDVARGFALGRTVDFGAPAIQALVLLLAALALHGLARAGRAQVLFLLVYLLAVVVGLALGSALFKPMYLGPHHIMAGAPAYLLLLAHGCRTLRWPAARALAAAVVMLAAGTALLNLYADPAYAREDYRGLVAHIEQNAGTNDIVLYNNAILLTLHSHYARRSDLTVTALPVYPRRAGAQTAGEVVQTLSGYARVWYVPEPPRDGRDDGGMVPQAVAEAGVPLAEAAFHGRFAVVNVVPLALDVAHVAPRAPLAAAPPADGETLWVMIDWSATQLRAAPDARLRLELRDPGGHIWRSVNLPRTASVTALPHVPLPAADWLRLSYGVPLPPGLPPGDYSIWLAEGDAAAQPLVASVPLAARPAPAVAGRPAVRFANGVELLAVAWADAATRPGNPLPGTLYWRLNAALPADTQWRYELIVRGADGELRRDDGPFVAGWLATEALPVGVPLAQPIGVYPRPETPPGRYTVAVRLLDVRTGAPVAAVPGWWPLATGWRQHDRGVAAGRLRVLAWPRETQLPADVTPLPAPVRYGEAVELIAYTLTRNGERVAVTLYWRARALPPPLDVFLHLAPAADAPPLAQSNGVPAAGARPTVGWRSAEIVADRRTLDVGDVAGGSYGLYVGLYDSQSGARPAATLDGMPLPLDQYLLETVTLP